MHNSKILSVFKTNKKKRPIKMHPSGDSWVSCTVKINIHTPCTGDNPSFTLPNITKIKSLIIIITIIVIVRYG